MRSIDEVQADYAKVCAQLGHTANNKRRQAAELARTEVLLKQLEKAADDLDREAAEIKSQPNENLTKAAATDAPAKLTAVES